MKTLLIQAWTVHKSGEKYYLPYTHWVYLNEIVKYYDKVCLLSPVKNNSEVDLGGFMGVSQFKNVEVYHLPYSEGYVSAIRHFFSYVRAYKKLREHDVVYARYPIPFGWLQRVFMRNSKKIIHFVGDPIDTILNNPNINKFKKKLLICLFIPEYAMYLWACKKAKVYTNGSHISDKLKKYNIKAESLISSTLNEEDFYFDSKKVVDSVAPKLIYVGYLRKAKGIETVIAAFKILKETYPLASLTIVGSGELEDELKLRTVQESLGNINFMGHVDKREVLNELLRTHDVFCFASLSEGSPRVILEAMANGINVVSTPVGSLPDIFKDYENIVFSDYHNHKMFSDKIIELLEDDEVAFMLRKKAFDKTSNYTIENFLKNIFYEK
jgi:glycosyltransferase involved in cell wall biosynthesis